MTVTHCSLLVCIIGLPVKNSDCFYVAVLLFLAAMWCSVIFFRIKGA